MNIIKTLILIILIFCLILTSYFAYQNFLFDKRYEQNLEKIAQKSDLNALAQQKIDNFKSTISFGLLKNKTKKELQELQKETIKYKNLAKRQFYFYLISISIIILLSFLMTLKREVLILGFSMLISLVFGLLNPVLMVTIHKKVEYLGDIILSFESKGILDSVVKLLSNGENVVAMIILIFSVILPLLKSLTLVCILIFPSLSISHRFLNFFKYIGKWSMLDVFVVSTFLVYLASNSSQVTRAETGYGLYFFLIYIFLSIFTTIKVQKLKLL